MGKFGEMAEVSCKSTVSLDSWHGLGAGTAGWKWFPAQQSRAKGGWTVLEALLAGKALRYQKAEG